MLLAVNIPEQLPQAGQAVILKHLQAVCVNLSCLVGSHCLED